MGNRIDLQRELEEILGMRHVYFQPPESLKLQYPAIVYSLSSIDVDHADNKNYILKRRYMLTLILNDSESEVIEKILALQYCSLERTFIASNLYHYVYELYY